MLNKNSRPYDMRYLVAYAAVSLAAIFYLPTLVPMHPTASDSYLFGYNNRAGVVLLLLFSAVGAIWTKGMNLKLAAPGASEAVPRKVLLISLLAVLSGCLAMYLFAGRFGGFGESSYEIDRAWLLSQGRIPYIDFEWPFGAALLYLPVLLSRLLSIGIVPAYYLFWAINCLLGTLLLYAVVNRVDYPTRFKKTIYLIIFCAWFLSILNMGTHYTLVRYTCPLYLVLVVQKRLKGADTRKKVYGAFLAVAFTIVSFLISPEIGIAFAFASVCVFLVSDSAWRGRGLAVFAGLVVGLAGVLLIDLKLHVLDTVKASGGGADSFPIPFAPYMLIFFAATFYCACYVFQRLSFKRFDDNTIGLIAFSVPMTAAALGRCDPGHVLFNGLGIFLASLFYVSNYRALWKGYSGALVVFLLLLPALSGIWLYLPLMGKCGLKLIGDSGSNSALNHALIRMGKSYIEKFANPAKRTKWEKTLEDAQSARAPKEVDFRAIYPLWHGEYLAPLGYKPNGIGTYLSNQVDYGYFEGFENANTVGAIEEKLAEIKEHPEKALLLPDHFEETCRINVESERKELKILFDFPYFGKAVHTESVREPVCNYIFAQYELRQAPTAENFEYGLWVARTAGR